MKRNGRKDGDKAQHVASHRSIIRPPSLLIYLTSHDDHPDQKHKADDPKGKDCVPFVADGVLFQPGQRVETDAVDFVVGNVVVASGGHIALVIANNSQQTTSLLSFLIQSQRISALEEEEKNTTYISKQLNRRLNESSQEQHNQHKRPQNHITRVQIILRNHDEHDNDKEHRQ